ncbi:hypothetical protein SDJN03_15593, partial [Cucurbita argyrosperma subsp. sororia]
MNEAISMDSDLTGRRNAETGPRDRNLRFICGGIRRLTSGLYNCPGDLWEVATAAANPRIASVIRTVRKFGSVLAKIGFLSMEAEKIKPMKFGFDELVLVNDVRASGFSFVE